MVTPDKNERSRQRRQRETRARKVLVSVSILSLLGGTATMYAANPPDFTSDETSSPSLLNEADPTATTRSAQPAPANDGTSVDDDEASTGVRFPNVTVASSKSSWDDDEDDDYEYDDYEYDDDEYEDDEEKYEAAATATATAPATEAADPTATTAPEPTPTTEIVVPQRPSNSRSSSSR